MSNFIEKLVPTFEQQFQKYLQDFRKNHIPERYNQVEMLNHLSDPEIDHMVSITNRTDGKSFNYIHALLNIAIEYDLGITFICRNMMLRLSYQTLIEEIVEESTILEKKHLTFIRSQYYIRVDYKGKTIGVISDLNNATELKQFSNFLKRFPLIVYDEFLALETDYLPDEWERLKTIYESIDRMEVYPLIVKPKIIYLGNPINFSSPILAGLEIFKILENHPVNTCRVYKNKLNIVLEMYKNDNANERRNTRAFASNDDSMTTGQFEVNNFMLASDNDLFKIKANPRHVYVKLVSDYLDIFFNRDTFDIVLSIKKTIPNDYDYNLKLKDNTSTSIYLNPKYFDEDEIKKIDRGAYLFENNYSKDYITNDFHELNNLKILKLIREFLHDDTPEVETESKEFQYELNYIEQSKRGLMKKMWG